MKTALCLRHVLFEGLGSLEQVLVDAGYRVDYADAGVDDFALLDPLTPDLLVILGGPVSVNQVDEYPFIRHEVGLIRTRLLSDLPTLGICLGSQLMASALGARVYPAAAAELGWSPVELTEFGRQSCLAALVSPHETAPTTIPVMHWHGDTFDLPEGATRLASTVNCVNQAYVWKQNGLALQFHAEVTAPGLEQWLISYSSDLAREERVSVQSLRHQTAEHATTLAQCSRAMIEQWLSSLRV